MSVVPQPQAKFKSANTLDTFATNKSECTHYLRNAGSSVETRCAMAGCADLLLRYMTDIGKIERLMHIRLAGRPAPHFRRSVHGAVLDLQD